MLLLCHRNRISWLCVNQRRHQATTKKGRGYFVLTLPQNVKQLRRFLGMVQCYRDLWAQQSEMLSPLTNLVGEFGHNKATRATKTKHTLWHLDDVHQTAFDNIKTTIAKDVVFLVTLVSLTYTNCPFTQKQPTMQCLLTTCSDAIQ